MEKENRISVWAGKFKDESNFQNYIAETYDEEGGMFSKFTNDFNIDFFDIDFSESFFTENVKKSNFTDLSYSESFLDKVFAKVSSQNSFLIIYDFEYDGNIRTSNNSFEFLGSFDYLRS